MAFFQFARFGTGLAFISHKNAGQIHLKQLYPISSWRAIAPHNKAQFLTCGIVLIGIIICAVQVPPPSPAALPSRWRIVTLAQPGDAAQPLAPPVVLEKGVIWRPLGEDALIFSDLAGKVRRRYDWLRGVPLRWLADQSPTQIYLTWQTSEGVLWVALLNPEGEQLTAPIEVANHAEDFKTVLLDDGRLICLFIENGTLLLRPIDPKGRPMPSLVLETGVKSVAAAAHNNQLYLAWQTGNTLFAGRLTLDQAAAAPTIQDRLPITDFALPAYGWLSSLLVLLPSDQQEIILWGFGTAAQPDTETYQGVMLPAQNAAAPQFFTLARPHAPLLRWAQTDQENRQVTLAAHIGGEWQAAFLNFDANGVQGYQLINGAAVTGSPIGMRGMTLSWVTLDSQAQPRLYVTTLDPRFGQSPPTEEPPHWREEVRKGIANSPYLVLWLIAPLTVGLFGRRHPYRLPLTTAAYWLGKGLIPLGLFSAYPLALQSLGIASPFFLSGSTLAGITFAAALVAVIGWERTPLPVRYAAYWLTDAFLTFAIFGGRVEWFGS